MLFGNDEVKDAVKKAQAENKSQLWDEEKACFKAGFMAGLGTAGAAFTAALLLAWKICKK